jgi:hypothetical protein
MQSCTSTLANSAYTLEKSSKESNMHGSFFFKAIYNKVTEYIGGYLLLILLFISFVSQYLHSILTPDKEYLRIQMNFRL